MVITTENHRKRKYDCSIYVDSLYVTIYSMVRINILISIFIKNTISIVIKNASLSKIIDKIMYVTESFLYLILKLNIILYIIKTLFI